ncbi:hypothetical protein JX266_010482 [Neoarthrinium moseri]|nr:hypothetical protein JX266_010482 [Neoarthrinium moseri]
MAPADNPKVTFSLAQAEAVRAAIEHWSERKLEGPALASEVLLTLRVENHSFQWQRFAKYAFRLALISLAIALVTLLCDIRLILFIKHVLAPSAWLRSILPALGAVVVHVWGCRRQVEYPLQVWTNEAVHGLGGLLFGLSAQQFLEALDAVYPFEEDRLHWVLLLLVGIYSVTGVVAASNFIWSCGIIITGFWFAAITAYLSGSDDYFLGMSHPLRFVLFGLVIIRSAYAMRLWDTTAALWRTTRIRGLLCFFNALWLLSVIGNDYDFWRSKSIKTTLAWSTVSALAAGCCVIHGLRYRDGTVKGFGLTFLGINLFTKFCEVLFDILNTPVFFAILAGFPVGIGRYAENIWNMQLAF